MKVCGIVIFGLCVVLSGCRHGPEKDYGRFKSADLIQDGQTIVFTFHDLVYRSAVGLAAFPDGGMPKYMTDSSVICTLDRETGKLTKLMEKKNREWTDGSGALHIVTSRGNAILLSQSGQSRRDLNATLTRYHLLNIASGVDETFELHQDLRKYGRKQGAIYLGDDEGTLVIMTLADNSGNSKSASAEVPEIWVRRMGGGYIFACRTAYYQQTTSGEVIYWKPEDRNYYAFNIEKGTTRLLDNYKIPEIKQVTESVSIGSSGASLDMGVRTDDGWQYKPLPVSAADIRAL